GGGRGLISGANGAGGEEAGDGEARKGGGKEGFHGGAMVWFRWWRINYRTGEISRMPEDGVSANCHVGKWGTWPGGRPMAGKFETSGGVPRSRAGFSARQTAS